MYKLVCTSDEFSGVDVLARQSIAKGVCGEVFGMNVVRVPKSYLPEGVYFLVAHKDAVLMPYKIADGSDPRYSDSAKDYVAGTSLTAETGCKIRAVMTESGKYPSAVAEG